MGDAMHATTSDGTKVSLHDDGTWTALPYAMTSGSAPAPGFRKAPWGSSKAAIKASEEKEPDFEASDSLGFNTVLAELETLAYYILVDDQLARAKYIVQQEYHNRNNYIAAFDRLKSALTSKYGPSIESDVFWNNDLYQDDPAEWGMAISVGHHSRFETWAAEDTTLCLALMGENFDVRLEIEYTSVSLGAVESGRKEANLLADL